MPFKNKMPSKMKTIIIAISIILGYQLSYSQSIKDNQIEVMKEFNSEIYSANPISNDFNIIIPQRQEMHFSNDSLIGLKTHSPNLSLDIKPLAYKEQILPSSKSNYAQLHKGTINSWHGEISATHIIDNYFSLDGYAKYDKWQNNKITDKFTEDMQGKFGIKYYITDNLLGTINIAGQKGEFGKYAFNTLETAASRDTILANTYQADFSLRSFNSGPKAFNFSIQGKIIQSSYDKEHSEKIWGLSPSLSLNFGKRWRVTNETHYNYGTLKEHNSLFTLNNKFNVKYNTEKWSQSIGVSYVKSKDDNIFFPQIFTHLIVNKDLLLSMRLDQEIDYQGLNTTFRQNPYVETNEFVPNTSIKQSLTVAVENRFNKSTTLNLEVSYNKFTDAQNFSNSLTDISLFNTELVDFKVLSFRSRVNYTYSKNIDAGLTLTYSKFETDEVLYNRPSTIAKPFLDLHTSNRKISVKTWGTFNTRQNIYKNSNEEIVKTGIRKDVSAEISLNIFKNIDITLNGDNLLNDQYEVLGGYSAFDRNISGGVLIKF